MELNPRDWRGNHRSKLDQSPVRALRSKVRFSCDDSPNGGDSLVESARITRSNLTFQLKRQVALSNARPFGYCFFLLRRDAAAIECCAT